MIDRKQPGFTIIELLIATSVFSVVLLMCTYGIIHIGRNYQKSQVQIRTQEVARSVMTHIAEAIQFGGGDVVQIATNDSSEGFCIGNRRYSFRKNLKLVDSIPNAGQTNHALVTDFVSGCNASNAQDLSVASGITGEELLSPNMRLVHFSICLPDDSCGIPAGSGLYGVTIKVAYGDTDLTDPTTGNCVALHVGGSFCAVSELSTTVEKRIRR